MGWRALDVPITIGGEEHSIHTIMASTTERLGAAPSSDEVNKEVPLILWAGFGQGPASYWQSLPELSRAHAAQGPVYAIDWAGVGLSTRPAWGDHGSSPAAAEAFFSDALEQWREQMVNVRHVLSQGQNFLCGIDIYV